jgi:hypothetical protein
MNNISVLLDVALSLTFFYLIASMFVSGIVEFINTLIEKRSDLLWEALGKLQNSWAKGQTGSLEEHPLVRFFEHEKGMAWSKAVSYISTSTFVIVVLDKMKYTNGDDLTKLKDLLLSNLEEGDFKKIISIFLNESKNIKEFKEKLSTWFDQYMVQVSGWYKRYTRIVLWIVSLIVTICLNLNSITITQQLYTDPVLRESMVKQALDAAKSKSFADFEKTKDSSFLKNLQKTNSSLVNSTDRIKSDTNKVLAAYRQFKKLPDSVTANKDSIPWKSPSFVKFVKESKDSTLIVKGLVFKENLSTSDSLQVKNLYLQYLQQSITGLGLPIGWTHENCDSINFWNFIGWILTAAALSFGAPFWFDLLLKIVNIRNVVNKQNVDK